MVALSAAATLSACAGGHASARVQAGASAGHSPAAAVRSAALPARRQTTSESWLGPLMVSGRQPGLFALDPNGGSTTLFDCVPGLCLDGDGEGYLYGTTDPAAGDWTRSPLPSDDFADVSCASASFCAAVTDTRALRVRVSAQPVSGPWSAPVQLNAHEGDDASISCPAVGECLLLGPGRLLYDSAAVTTAGSWRHFTLPRPESVLSCPATNLCFAATPDFGSTLVSTDPTAGPSAWTRAAPPLAGNLPSCASATACALVTPAGDIYTSSAPAQPGSWHLVYREPQVRVLPDLDPGPVACTAPARCIAVTRTGRIFYTDDLTGGRGAWHLGSRLLNPLNTDMSDASADCAGSTCIVQTNSDATHAIVAPSRPSSWRTSQLTSSGTALLDVDCPSTTLCVADDSAGRVQVTQAPTAGGQWTALSLAQPILDVTCGSPTACAAVGRRGALLVSASPAAGHGAWAPVAVADRIAAVSCPRSGFCAAIASDGRTYTSTVPGHAWAWTRHPVLAGWRSAPKVRPTVSCWSAHGCVIAGDGAVWSSRNPGSPHAVWRRTVVPAAAASLSLACPSARRCLARTAVASLRHTPALTGSDVVSRSPRWSARRAQAGLVRCFGERMCADILHARGFVHDQVRFNVDGGKGRFVRTFDSGIESDEPPSFVSLDGVACVPGRFCVITTGDGSVFVGRPGPHRCTFYDGADISCRAAEVAETG